MLREQGMYYDNINPSAYKNFGATGYGQGFYKQEFNEDMRPTTASTEAYKFDQTGFDVNDREDQYEQTNFNLNDREEEEEDFDVNERAEEDFDANDRADDDFDVNNRSEEPEFVEQSTSTAATVSAEENKKVIKNPEDRVIRSTGVYNYEAFMEKAGGSPNVNRFITYRKLKNCPKTRK